MMKNFLLVGALFLAVGCATDEADEPIQTLPANTVDSASIISPFKDLVVNEQLFVVKNSAHDLVEILEGATTVFPQTRFALCDALPDDAAFACDVDAIREAIELGTCRTWTFDLDGGAKYYVGGCR